MPLQANETVLTKPTVGNSLTRIGREWGMTQSYIDQLTRHKVKLLCIKERCLFSEKGVTRF